MTKMTDKHTKAQILEAYYKLLENFNENASLKHDPAADVLAKKTTDTLSSAAKTVEQSVEHQITELQKTMQSVLINLSGSFADKVKEYSTVEEAIAIKKAELKEVHDIEVQAFSLAALVNTHKELADQFNVESEETRNRFNAELSEIKNEIFNAKELHKKELQEEKGRLEVERKREQEEYNYNFERTKQKNEDDLNDYLKSERKTFEEEVRQVEKEQLIRENEINEREEDISIREEKIGEFEAKIAELPLIEAKLKEDIEASIKAQYDKTAAIKENAIKKHYESDARVLQSQLDSLQAQFESERTKNSELSEKLDTAYEKIQAMAIATTNRPTVEYRTSGENK